MAKRPGAVTVIGWFWRVGGIVGMVLAIPYTLWGESIWGEYRVDSLQRLSPTIFFLWVFSASLLCLLLGNGLLKGRNWSRILVLAYCVAATLIGTVVYQGHFLVWFNLICNLAFTLMMWFFLYRPAATAYFKGEGHPDEPELT